MNNIRTAMCFVVLSLIVGCSALNSSSSFDDVAESVSERRDFVQVLTKDITPVTETIMGQGMIKTSLYYIGRYPKTGAADVPESYVDLKISFFKNYRLFDSVMLGDNVLPVTQYRPAAETCAEYCTVTQWLRFPLSPGYLAALQTQSVEFVLSSAPKNQVRIVVPKAYFDAAEREAGEVIERRQPIIAVAPQAVIGSAISQAEQMVRYWYDEGSTDEQQQFIDWAFSQRTDIRQTLKADSEPLKMMVYWYNKATKTEKLGILSWLINQESLPTV